MPTDSSIFEDWIKTNPPPNLQKMIKHYGGYHLVPQEMWTKYDIACAKWEEKRLSRLMGAAAWQAIKQQEERIREGRTKK